MKRNRNLLKISLFFFYLLFTWGGYRFLTNFSELWDELLFKPLLWLAPLLWVVKKLEKEKLASLGLVFEKPTKEVLAGLGVSLFILSEYLLALFFKGSQIRFNPQGLKLFFWFFYFLSCLMTGFVEELVFRGFFMTRINSIINSKLVSNIYSSFLFFLIHLPILVFNQNQSWQGIVQYLAVFGSLGLFDGYIFWKTKGILAPIVAHASLNFFSFVVG